MDRTIPAEKHAAFAESFGHNAKLGIQIAQYGRGWMEAHLDWKPELVVDPATESLSTGAIVSLMDYVCGTAVWSAIDDIHSCVTLDLRVDYLKPARARRRIFARGECFRITRRIAFARGTAHDGESDRPIAMVAGTFMYALKDR
ncbi:PaaI family thioesterase [Sphingobium chlorophenolicum]|uniref:Phenylacetic acid degradation-like protein n=1 Tax=Sphingobium chlorophenolicum TaxID=46429 RepID=A0A081RDY4_SPHCR|nr:PaaI family thioesterase [Sphingobium chlorophenolicum]KEQ53407.1 Phenylacetic acid degradation-like protein [Sphingobium chlorophenolicum]